MNRQAGVTLVELMVALLIGLLVVAGSYSVFSMSARSVGSTGQHSQLQQSGRMALRILQQDLAQQGFFADLTGTDLVSTTVAIPPLPAADDCLGGGLNNGSYPTAIGYFRTLWAERIVAASVMASCRNRICCS
ncbi:PilW family protein [Ferrimonas senticii]|uniref:PilW family protein n=1 Tax=Ferrimonas senticii TaxID=394566 RepID=UPI00040EA75F|nr:prepilin-type N-terminal cleavage/methylation domain-containing protein [Ferrimonas senticii]